MMIMRQEDNKEEKEVELGGSEPEVAARRRCRKTLARLVTHPVQPHGRPLPLHHLHLCLASMEVSLPFSSQRGTLSAGGAQGRRRGAGYLGRRSIDLSGALHILKPNWEKTFQKRKSFLSWCSWLFCVNMCQFLKRPVWRKISICEINFNSKIQKSKLKRNL